jgi:hypothetical protein
LAKSTNYEAPHYATGRTLPNIIQKVFIIREYFCAVTVAASANPSAEGNSSV